MAVKPGTKRRALIAQLALALAVVWALWAHHHSAHLYLAPVGAIGNLRAALRGRPPAPPRDSLGYINDLFAGLRPRGPLRMALPAPYAKSEYTNTVYLHSLLRLAVDLQLYSGIT